MGLVITARHRNTALLVAGCFFMEMLDGTIVSTSAPQIGKSLHAPPTSVGLVITAYLLTLAVLIPLSGWLTRRFGNRPIFLTAIAIFTLASVGCAASVNLGMLVGMRVIQGAGGAMMVPVGRNMVISMADKKDLLKVTSYVVWPGLIAPVIAPLAGGLITTYATWHWMFLINVPLGIVAFTFATRLIENLPGTGTRQAPLDWLGVLLTCAGLGGLTYAAHLVSEASPPVAITTAFAVASAILLAGAIWHLRRAPHPLLNLRTLRVHTFRITQRGGTLYYMVCGAMPFLLPLEFQTQFGWSPVKSGALTLFIFVGNVGIKPATTPLINRFGFRAFLIASTAGTVIVVALLALITASTPLPLIALLAVAQGVFRSTGMTTYSTVGFADTPPEDVRDASTLLATSQQLATGLSVAVATVFLRIGGGTGRAAYITAFLLLAAIAIGPAIEALRMRRDAGDAARRRSRDTTRPEPTATHSQAGS
jgi:EmrB/QacA subfamily drug resistance transporter